MAVQRRPKTGKDQYGRVRWVGRYRDHTGREHSRSFDREKDAKAWVAEEERKLRRGTWLSPEDMATTLKDIAEEWRDEATKANTVANRKALVDNLGELADMPVYQVRPGHIIEWRKTLLEGRPWKPGKHSKMSASTVAVMTGQLAGLLKRANADGVIDKIPRISAPKAPPRQAVRRQDLLTPGHIAGLVDLCNDGRPTAKGKRARTGWVPKRPWLGRMILLAAGTGLRVSEVAGLHPEDVDEAKQVLHVERQASIDGAETVPTKNGKPRVVPLSDGVLEVLREQLRVASPAPGTALFPREGQAYHTRNSIGTTFARLVDSWGKRECSFHDLRHYYASSLLASGVPVNVVQDVLGHADAVTTMTVYAHLLPDALDVAREGAAVGFDLVRAECGQKPGRGEGTGLRAM